jgi:hypothetical protein
MPLHVPSGLIHHWIGAVFIPNATVGDVLTVTRDYAHYKDYYKPGVADANTLSLSDFRDRFTIRLENSSVLSNSVLEGTYTSDFVPITDKRWYSVSATTQMREIKNPGRPDEKRFLPDHGNGYIWRLYSTARMQERDGGVILELEAIALSRDIPASLRWIADPIVRRISRESLEKSLNETAQAVHEHIELCGQAHLASDPIIVSGTCSRHADYPGLRYQKLAGNAGR